MGVIRKAWSLAARAATSLRARPGVPYQSGVEIRSGQFQYDHVRELRGHKRYDVFAEMEGDPYASETLAAVRDPLATGKWLYEAASDKPKDQEVAEFCNAVLLRRPSDRFGPEYWTQTSWEGQRLLEILDCQRVGFSLFGFNWRQVGTKVVLDRIVWIEPKSIDQTNGWDLDDRNDDLRAVYRSFATPSGKFVSRLKLPVENLAVYVFCPRGSRFEGRPTFRSIFGAWKQKNWLIREEMQWARKVGSPPPIVTYPSDLNDAVQIGKIEDFARGMAMSEVVDAYAVMRRSADGKGLEVTYPATAGTGQVDRMGSLISRKNGEIAHGGYTKSRLLGETQSGSRALGETQSADEDCGHQAIAILVAEQEMHGYGNVPGLMDRLVTENFGPVPRPRLCATRIGPREDRTAVLPLIQVWSSTAPDLLKRKATERLGFALTEDEYLEIESEADERRAEMQRMLGGAVDDPDDQDDPDADPEADPDDDPDGSDPPRPPRPASARAVAFNARIRELLKPASEARSKGRRRPPTVLEDSFVNLAEVQDAYRVGEADMLNAFRGLRREMIADLMARLRAGKVKRSSIEGQQRSQFRGSKKAKAALIRLMREIAKRGQEHARQELARQPPTEA